MLATGQAFFFTIYLMNIRNGLKNYEQLMGVKCINVLDLGDWLTLKFSSEREAMLVEADLLLRSQWATRVGERVVIACS